MKPTANDAAMPSVSTPLRRGGGAKGVVLINDALLSFALMALTILFTLYVTFFDREWV